MHTQRTIFACCLKTILKTASASTEKLGQLKNDEHSLIGKLHYKENSMQSFLDQQAENMPRCRLKKLS
jgi:hypothetical protein